MRNAHVVIHYIKLIVLTHRIFNTRIVISTFKLAMFYIFHEVLRWTIPVLCLLVEMEDGNPIPSLDQFPSIPRAGWITVAESHSEIHAVQSTKENPATAKGFCPLMQQYTAIDGNQLSSHLPYNIPTFKTSNTQASLIVDKRKQGIPKALWDSWWENGIKGIYLCLLDAEKSGDVNNLTKGIIKVATGVTSLVVKIYEAPTTFYTYLYPHLEWKVEEVNEEFSCVRRWKESWIRAIAWHPTTAYLAIALNDDSLRYCVVGRDVISILRCQEQVNVSCISWRPCITTELAVGCENCIVIWNLTKTKLGKYTWKIIKSHGHGPVNSVEYTENGMHLLSSSAKDSSVYIYNTDTLNKAPLRRIGGGGISLATWAPNSSRLLAASPNNVFWIWSKVESWKYKRWTTPKTRIEAACWNPSSTILLFATGGFIYGIFYELSPVERFVSQADSVVKPLFNIEERHISDTEGVLQYKVGGKVRKMDWDETGHRIAIMFDDSDLIALFRVLPKVCYEILSPLGFLRGHPDETPCAMTFQKNFAEGALLTVAWNSGRIQQFPMIFALPSTTRNILHLDNYRTQNVVQGRPSSFAVAGLVSPRLSLSGAEASLSSQYVSELINQEEPTSPSRLFSVSRDPRD